EELLRGGEEIAVRTGRARKVGEGAGHVRRRLQIQTGVGPAQSQLVVQQSKIEMIQSCQPVPRSPLSTFGNVLTSSFSASAKAALAWSGCFTCQCAIAR